MFGILALTVTQLLRLPKLTPTWCHPSIAGCTLSWQGNHGTALSVHRTGRRIVCGFWPACNTGAVLAAYPAQKRYQIVAFFNVCRSLLTLQGFASGSFHYPFLPVCCGCLEVLFFGAVLDHL